jgi:dTDP-4-amino-4,6-dideoxygalactose transaminase
MQDQQNNREHLLDQLDRKVISVDDANVQMVRQERFRVVHKLPASIRKALNAAVKSGQLGHMKKDGVKPEIYYHPTFKHLAIEERNKHVHALSRALEATCQ